MRNKIKKGSKYYIKLLFYSLVLLISIFLIFEVIVRYENFGWRFLSYKFMKSEHNWFNSEFVYNFRPREKVTRFTRDGVPCWSLDGMVPNKRGYFKGAVFSTNSWGWRDKEYKIQNDNNTFRIIVLGDSFSVGFGVDIENVYHSIIEDNLNKRMKGKKYEVISMAYGGRLYVFQDCRLLQLNDTLPYYPDLILLTSVEATSRNLALIDTFQEYSGVPVLLYFLNEEPEIKYHPRILITNLNVSVGKKYIYPYDHHPNEFTHRKYAQKLLDFIIDNEDAINQRSKPIEHYRIRRTRYYPENKNRINGFWKSYFLEKVKYRFIPPAEPDRFNGAPFVSKNETLIYI